MNPNHPDRAKFLEKIAENDDDPVPHKVFADWLDENGDPDEADRQRKYPAAKWWLQKLARDNNENSPGTRHKSEDGYEYEGDEMVVDLDYMIEEGLRVVSGREEDYVGTDFNCGNNQGMCDALRDNKDEFWRNWSIVTGVVPPPGFTQESFFRCAC